MDWTECPRDRTGHLHAIGTRPRDGRNPKEEDSGLDSLYLYGCCWVVTSRPAKGWRQFSRLNGPSLHNPRVEAFRRSYRDLPGPTPLDPIPLNPSAWTCFGPDSDLKRVRGSSGVGSGGVGPAGKVSTWSCEGFIRHRPPGSPSQTKCR